MRTALAWLIGCASFGAALAEDRMLVQLPALLDPAVAVDPDVKEECKLAPLVGEKVFEQIKALNPGTTPAPASPGDERLIRLRITAAQMIPAIQVRRLTLAGELVEGDRVIGVTSFRAASAAMPGYGLGLCDIMGNIAATIGKNIAYWARRNYVGARATPKPAPGN